MAFDIPDRMFQFASTTITDTANDILQADPSGNQQIYVTGLYCTNGHATTDTDVVFKQTTTEAMRFNAAADGGGFAIAFPHPVPWGYGNSLQVANATDSSDTNVTVTYYIGA